MTKRILMICVVAFCLAALAGTAQANGINTNFWGSSCGGFNCQSFSGWFPTLNNSNGGNWLFGTFYFAPPTGGQGSNGWCWNNGGNFWSFNGWNFYGGNCGGSGGSGGGGGTGVPEPGTLLLLGFALVSGFVVSLFRRA